jgi:hypothetical protein
MVACVTSMVTVCEWAPVPSMVTGCVWRHQSQSNGYAALPPTEEDRAMLA